nr:histone deacetylase 14 [Tanacetum cinerariifolium]
EAKNEKTTVETIVESMVYVIIQQDTSVISLMTTPVIDLTSRPDSPNVHRPLQVTETETIMTITTTTKTHPPPPQTQQSTTDSMLIKRIDELEHIMANLIQDNKHLEERKKKKRRDSPKTPPRSPPHQPPPPSPPTGPSGTSGSPRASGSSQVPPPPPSTNQEGQSHGSTAPSSSKTATSAEYTAWTTTDTRLRPYVSLIPEDLHMDEDMAPNEHIHSSDHEDIGNAHIPEVNLRQDWWKPLEKDRPATPEPAWSIPSSDLPVPTNNWASTLASTYTPPPENSLLAHNVSKPLPLGGPPSQVTIQSDFFFNKDLKYLRYSSKGGRPALSISKMKATYYLDVGLEQMVPDQMWIEEECKNNIAAMYGISHWWFQRQRFYIDRHTSKGDRRAVRTYMRILSIVRIEVFSMYGYDYMKKIVLRRADLNEHMIAERDFKYLYPNDFEDLYLLNLQGHLNHLPPKDQKILTTATQLNLTKPRWGATGFEYKHDFMVIDSPRAVTFRDKYEVQMIMQFNEIHKFSDGTLHQINEALDYRVKEFKVNRMNPVDIEKVAVCSSLRSLKPKRTIEFRAKRSSKNLIRTLFHYACFFTHCEKWVDDELPSQWYQRMMYLLHVNLRAAQDELVKENQEKDKIRSKPDKNGKHDEAGKSLKQLQ